MLLLAKNLFSKYFLFGSESGKFLVKNENISSSACEDDTYPADSMRKKKEAFGEKKIKGTDYVTNNEDCKCGIANEQGFSKNRILYPTEVKHNTYPWVVQIFLYRK